jgi:predicted nucleotidyltransferase
MADYLTTRDVARALLISEQRVRQLSAAGKIPHRTTPGGHRRYRLGEVLAALGRPPADLERALVMKGWIQEVEPGATVILFGSRARGDAREHSDWDFVVLVDGEVTPHRESRLSRHLSVIQDPTQYESVVALMFNREVWSDPQRRPGELHHFVSKEGIVL